MSVKRRQKDIVPNQIFIGCPWINIKSKYEEAIERLKKRFPVSFVIVGRKEGQEAKDLLEHIKQRILSSSFAVFDATNGNANVSLEYGFAEATEIPLAIYFCIHKASRLKSGTKDSPIIADLAGKTRNQYTNSSKLYDKLVELIKEHSSYTKAFEDFIRKQRGSKKSARSLALKVIHSLDLKIFVRRFDVVSKLTQEGYKKSEVDRMVSDLHRANLITSGRGPSATLRIPW